MPSNNFNTYKGFLIGWVDYTSSFAHPSTKMNGWWYACWPCGVNYLHRDGVVRKSVMADERDWMNPPGLFSDLGELVRTIDAYAPTAKGGGA